MSSEARVRGLRRTAERYDIVAASRVTRRADRISRLMRSAAPSDSPGELRVTRRPARGLRRQTA